MNKSILFIEKNASFLINAIIGNLKNAGFDCHSTKYDVDAISEVEASFDCFFLNLDTDSANEGEAVYVYLKDLYLNKRKKVFIMGEAADIDEIKLRLSPDMILDVFARPVNARTVLDHVVFAFESEEKQQAKKDILIVDDSGSFLHAAKEWLEEDYNVTMLNSATSAIAYLGTHKPDLILLDYEMPICSGPQMLSMLRSDMELSDIPVMFLTGNGDRESIQKVLSLKPQGYLLKTLTPDKIRENISNYFESERRNKMLKSNGYL